MTFDELRDALHQAMRAQEKAGEDDRRARQLHRRLGAARARVERSAGGRNSAQATRAQNLTTSIGAAEVTIRTRAAELPRVLETLESARRAFERFSDPRVAVTHMSDDVPFLLFPVRLETRFRPVEGAQTAELCVRVYPDDCSVDSFEPVPSDTEIENTRRYWIAEWQAAGNVGQRRAAWRGLVSGHGAGRAAWLRDTYKPVNLGERPAKLAATDVILVIVTDAAPAAADARSIERFWRDLWLADGDSSAVDAARSRLPTALRARQAEIEANPPVNFAMRPDAPLARDSVRVETKFLVLPSQASLDVQQNAWSRPPRVAAWPDRFVLLLYKAGSPYEAHLGALIPNPLIAGVDPVATAVDKLQHDRAGDLIVPPGMKWMTDFDEAVRVGMGFRIPVGSTLRDQTFEKLIVIGVRSSADAAAGKAELEGLITSHKHGVRGFSIVSQGTPSNNTEIGRSGFSQLEDADESFDRVVLGVVGESPTADALKKNDGQWLADWLGVSHDVVKDIPNAGGVDQAEAKAMNAVLWDGTLGYWMGTLMNPVFSEDAVTRTRQFFLDNVSGRGAVPAVRVGDQPYGILPVTAFSRMRWMEVLAEHGTPALSERQHLETLRDVLGRMNADWLRLAKEVPHVGGPGDRQQTLLKVMGLHATSVTYAQRWVESFATAFNRLKIAGAESLMSASAIRPLLAEATGLLQGLGYRGAEQPAILQQFHFSQHNELNGPVVDAVPLSETDPLAAVTPEGKNYIEWLAATARTSVDAVRLEAGFVNQQKPTALLYLILRYAILEGYFNASLRAREAVGLLDRNTIRVARKAASFIQVKAKADQVESRYAMLVQPEPEVTSSATLRVADYITRELNTSPSTETLDEQITALERLAKTPTARLERLFAEHVDCCNYRVDAWRLGLVHRQLVHMRRLGRGLDGRKTGVLLGAYGWLLDVKPRVRTLTSAPLKTPELRAAFGAGLPAMRDSTNGGYIHAPSQNQAVAAAVLRSGFVANASPANKDTCAVRLTSGRVRLARKVLDGIHAGMSLGSILGKQFERGLADRGADRLKYVFRELFTLDVNKMKATKIPANTRFARNSRNVSDGLALLETLRQQTANDGPLRFPFGLTMPADVNASAAERTAVEEEAARLLETFDAWADLWMAEGIYQVVNGNWARVTATFDAAAGAHTPVEPDVIRTPSNGFQLTHRVAVQLDPTITPTAAGTPRTPLSTVEPALNDWIAATLPALGSIACKVSYTAAGGAKVVRDVTLADLGLQPIDVLDVLSEQHGGSLVGQAVEDFIVTFVQSSAQPPDSDAIVVTHDDNTTAGSAIRILYGETVAASVSIARVTPLVRALRGLLSAARPLRPSDLATPTDASESPAMDAQSFVDRARISLVRDDLDALAVRMRTFVDALQPNVHKGPNDQGALAALVQRADQTINQSLALLLAATRFRVRAGVRFMHDWKRKLTGWLRAEVGTVEARWTRALTEHDSLMLRYPSATDDAHRFELLEQAERRVSASTTPRPATPSALQTVVATKRAAFQARLNQFRALSGAVPGTAVAQRSAIAALLPLAAFDVVEPSLQPYDELIRLMSDEAFDAVAAARSEIASRVGTANFSLNDHDASADNTFRVDALRKAARALLSDDVMLIPAIALSEDHAAELANAVGGSGALLAHLRDTERVDFPVDEWLYGCARVREPMRRWEQVVMLTGALGTAEPQLTPIQLPFMAGDSWLAGKFPTTYKLDGERLLYTAYWRKPFAATQRQCGLMLDEWTEVIPAREAKTAIAFHADIPSSEPQHAIALVTPSSIRGTWTWEDLVDGVGEMIDLARTRLVEPSHIDATPYAMFLPAVTTASAHGDITIAANFARNNMRIAVNQ